MHAIAYKYYCKPYYDIHKYLVAQLKHLIELRMHVVLSSHNIAALKSVFISELLCGEL